MTTSVSSNRLKQIVKDEINDPALKKRLSKLGSPHLDTLIRESGVVLEDRLRSVSGLNEDGVRLVDAAFSPGDKMLRFSQHPGEQEGVKMLYRGAMQFIRNPPMHKLVDYPIDTAKVLIRLIDSLLLLLPEPAPSSSSTGRNGTTRQKGGKTAFFPEAESLLSAAQVSVLGKLYSYAESAPVTIKWGTGARHFSFGLKYDAICPRTIITVRSDGTLLLNFGWIRGSKQTESFRDELKGAAIEKLGRTVPSNYVRRHARYPLEVWGTRVDALIEVLEDLVSRQITE